ncbi:hypothetical protein [Streptomyces sp. Isolate_45]|uniref:hypothetical protein n=1 Tax=Streptomyces sp. Isolate_45 TaxID=2950111 RepID=UPI002481C9F8|nr:hypothetical protein [Streptomyces sp. Isolate_45]
MNDCTAPAGEDDQDQPRMTIRVSRDGGRTYGPAVESRAGAGSTPMYSIQFPPCQCPRHRTD